MLLRMEDHDEKLMMREAARLAPPLMERPIFIIGGDVVLITNSILTSYKTIPHLTSSLGCKGACFIFEALLILYSDSVCRIFKSGDSFLIIS